MLALRRDVCGSSEAGRGEGIDVASKHGRFDSPMRPPSENVKDAMGLMTPEEMKRLKMGTETWVT